MAQYFLTFSGDDVGVAPSGWTATGGVTVIADADSATGYVAQFPEANNSLRLLTLDTPDLQSEASFSVVIKCKRKAGARGQDGSIRWGSTDPFRWDINFNGTEIRHRRDGANIIANGGYLRPQNDLWWIIKGFFGTGPDVITSIGHSFAGTEADGTELSGSTTPPGGTWVKKLAIETWQYNELLVEWVAIGTDGDPAPIPGASIDPPVASGTFSPPEGTVNSAYSYATAGLFTGGTPTSYAVATGTLPAGITLNTSTGLISGTPTTAGTAAGVSITATNTDGSDTTNTASIVVNAQVFTRTIEISNITVANGENVTLTLTNPSGFSITPLNRSVAVFIDAALPEQDYSGFEQMAVSSISEPSGMYMMETSGEAPFLIQASAENVICTGTFDNVDYDINPITDLEHRWEVTKSDGSPIQYLGETKKGTTRQTVNPATDTIGPTLSVWLHEAGSYRVRRTSRAPDGNGGYTQFVQDQTVTVAAMPSAVSHYWYSNTGDNANDGRDPHGFALSNAAYTESTGRLTQSGAFTNLNLANHKGDYDIFNGDKIFITGHGQRTIVEKINNDTIVISPKLGSDLTGLTSSNGPRTSWTFNNGRIPPNHFLHLKGGDSFSAGEISLQHDSIDQLTGTSGVASYDGQAEILSSSTGSIISTEVNPTRYLPKKSFLGKLKLNPNNTAIRGIGSNSQGGVMDGAFIRFWFDQLEIVDNWAVSTNQNAITLNINKDIKISLAVTNSEIRNITQAATPARKLGLFTQSSATSFETFMGNIVDNDATNSILDHHYYPSGEARLHIGWDYCRGGRNNNFNYNINDSGGAAGRIGPIVVHDSIGFNSNWFVDFADINNSQVSKTDNYYVARCTGVDQSTGFLFSVSNRQATLLDNKWWSNLNNNDNRGMFTINDADADPTEYHWKIARNLAINAPIVRDINAPNGPLGYQIYDNKVWTERTGEQGIALKVDSLPAGVEVFADSNEIYAPIPFVLDGSTATEAAFNTAVGGTNTAVSSFALPTKPAINDPPA